MRVRRNATFLILWNEDIPTKTTRACLYPTIQSCLDAHPSCSIVISVPPGVQEAVQAATEDFPDRSVPCRVVVATHWHEAVVDIDDDSELFVVHAGTSFKFNGQNFDLLVRRGAASAAALLIDDVCHHAIPDAEVTIDGHGFVAAVDHDTWDAPRRTRHKSSGLVWFRTAHGFKIARADADTATDAGRKGSRTVTGTLNHVLPAVGYYLDSAYNHVPNPKKASV